MSSVQSKFAIRMKLPDVTKVGQMEDVLDEMNIKYDSDDDFFWSVEDKFWNVHIGTETGAIYLDYEIYNVDDSDSYPDGSLSIAKVFDVVSLIPVTVQPDMRDVRIVSYSYYNGTDQPEVF